jgi:hypothetical protein
MFSSQFYDACFKYGGLIFCDFFSRQVNLNLEISLMQQLKCLLVLGIDDGTFPVNIDVQFHPLAG